MEPLKKLFKAIEIKDVTAEVFKPHWHIDQDIKVYDVVYAGSPVGSILTGLPAYGMTTAYNASPIYREANDRSCPSMFEAALWLISQYDENDADENIFEAEN